MSALVKLLLSFFVVAIALSFTVSPAHAKIGSRIWGVDGQLVSTLTGGGYPEYLADGAGGAFIVWEKDGSEIYAQKISSSGALGWGTTGVKISGSSQASQPKVVLDGSGGIVVAWFDYYDVGGEVFEYRINAQRVDANGDIVWTGSPDGLTLGTMASEQVRDQVYRNSTDTLRLIRTADGYYTVAYKAQDSSIATSLYVKMQKVDGDGVLQWGGDSVTVFSGDFSTYDISNIEMTIDEWGGTFVLWYNFGGDDEDIYLMRINGSGTDDWGSTIDVSNNSVADPQQLTGMRITQDGAGGLYVFWHVYEETVDAVLYGQRIASEGTLYWAAGGIALNTAVGGPYQQLIGVAETNTTYAVVTYMVATANDVRTMKVDSDGTILWTATSFVEGWLGYGTTTNTAVLSNGDVIVGSQTSMSVDSVNRQNIALQKLDGTTGTAEWTSEDFAISYPGMVLNTTMNYSIIPDPITETSLLLWSEGAYGDQQFYVQRSGDAYQVANLDATLDTVSTLDTNIEVGSQYGIGEEFPSYTDTVRLNNGGGLRVSDVETVFTQDRDWTGVSGEANGTTGVSVISGLDTAPGAAATHALYIPKIGAETTLHICPDATVLDDVTSSCTNGYDLATDDASVSEVTVSSVDYWRIAGLTGTGGMVVTPTPTATPTPTPTATPTSTPTPTPDPGVPPVLCTEIAPGSAPELFQIDTTRTSATLYFVPVVGITDYYISYSTKSSAIEHGVFAVFSSSGVQSYTIDHLSPGTRYYFKVRGQNGCMPGDWSAIKDARTLGDGGIITIIEEQIDEIKDITETAVEIIGDVRDTVLESIEQKNIPVKAGEVAALAVTATMFALSTGVLVLQVGRKHIFDVIGILLRALGFLGARKPQGMVYDAITNAPIPFALLTIRSSGDAQKQNIQETVVTGVDGTYAGFTLIPGSFSIQAAHQEYAFPTQKPRLALLSIRQFYKGETFAVTQNSGEQLFLIPMDKRIQDGVMKIKHTIHRLIEKISIIHLFWPLFIFSAVITFMYPTVVNMVVMELYIIVILVRTIRALKRPSIYGRIYDGKGRPVHNAIIRVTDVKNGELAALASSGKNGKYALFLKPNAYQFEIIKNGYAWKKTLGSMSLEVVDTTKKKTQKVDAEMIHIE